MKNQKANGKAWWWQCMGVVLVTVLRCRTRPVLYCKLCKQLLIPSNPFKTHLKITVCKGHHMGVREGLIPQEQQHQAAANSSSNKQT